MILFGCLLAFGLAVAPRAMLVLAWIFSARWPIVWGGDFLMPLLGIIFVPYTTIMYLLVWKPTGIDSWDWLWIILGLILDVMHWVQTWEKRQQVPYYPGGTSPLTSGSSTGRSSTTSGSTGSSGSSSSASWASAPKPVTPPAATPTPAPTPTPPAAPPPSAAPPASPPEGGQS